MLDDNYPAGYAEQLEEQQEEEQEESIEQGQEQEQAQQQDSEQTFLSIGEFKTAVANGSITPLMSKGHHSRYVFNYVLKDPENEEIITGPNNTSEKIVVFKCKGKKYISYSVLDNGYMNCYLFSGAIESCTKERCFANPRFDSDFSNLQPDKLYYVILPLNVNYSPNLAGQRHAYSGYLGCLAVAKVDNTLEQGFVLVEVNSKRFEFKVEDLVFLFEFSVCTSAFNIMEGDVLFNSSYIRLVSCDGYVTYLSSPHNNWDTRTYNYFYREYPSIDGVDKSERFPLKHKYASLLGDMKLSSIRNIFTFTGSTPFIDINMIDEDIADIQKRIFSEAEKEFNLRLAKNIELAKKFDLMTLLNTKSYREKQIESDIYLVSKSISAYQNKYFEELIKLDVYNAQLNAIRSANSSINYDDIIHDIAKLDIVHATKDSLYIRSNRIILQFDGETVDFGVFIIVVDADMNISVHPFIDNIEVGGCWHPHISSNSSVCFGAALDAITEHRKTKNLYGLVKIVLELINNYNPGSPYKPFRDYIDRERHPFSKFMNFKNERTF